MGKEAEAFAEVLAGLRREFEAGLADRAAELRAHAPAALAGDAAALAAFRMPVHALAGTGATFGHPAISDAALELEDMIDRAVESGRVLPPGAGALLGRLLAILDGIGGR